MIIIQTILKVIMLVEFLCSIYLLSFRKQVYSIMNKEGVDISKDVDGFKDYKSIYFVLKRKCELNKHDWRILWQHIIITIFAIILFAIFMGLVFFTDWGWNGNVSDFAFKKSLKINNKFFTRS